MNSKAPVERRPWRFLALTLFMWAWMLAAPRFQDRWLVHGLLQTFLLAALLATLRVNPEWRRLRRLMVALWLVSLAGSALAFAPLAEPWDRYARDIESIALLPLLALLAAGILRFVYRSGQFTFDGLFATIVVYMIVALIFARLYVLLVGLDPNSFSLPVPAGERARHLLQVDLLYFSFVTLATVGYGDVLPLSGTARMLAMIEAMAGQFYVAVVVALFVGMFASQRRAG